MALVEHRFPRRAPGAGARLIGGGVVVARASQTYSLSDVGGEIWKLSSGRRTVDDIAAAIAREYGAGADDVREDVVEFVDELVAGGFMEWADTPDPDATSEDDWTNRRSRLPHFDPATYDDFIREDVPDYDRLQDALADATADRPARSILDLGTGTGETARRVLARHPDARLTGIDASASMLDAASRRLGERASVIVARLQDPLPTGPFDLVTSALAVHRLADEDKRDLFDRVRGVLKAEGGRFVLGDAVAVDDPANATTAFYPGHDHPSSLADHERWLAEAGLVARVAWRDRDLVVLVATAEP
jgi:tRNA (cmo5U34)-methyltransferase